MITDVEELPDGRYVIVLRGLVKFRVTGEDQSRPYRLARVEAMPEVPDDEQRAALRRQRPRLTALLAEVAAPDSEPPPPALPDEDLVNGLAQYLEIDPIERQDLLERKDLALAFPGVDRSAGSDGEAAAVRLDARPQSAAVDTNVPTCRTLLSRQVAADAGHYRRGARRAAII